MIPRHDVQWVLGVQRILKSLLTLLVYLLLPHLVPATNINEDGRITGAGATRKGRTAESSGVALRAVQPVNFVASFAQRQGSPRIHEWQWFVMIGGGGGG